VLAPVGVAHALRDRAEVLEAGEGEVDLRAGLDQLRERGLGGVLCEGGPSLLTALLAGGLLDEVCWTVVPRLVGGGPAMVGPGARPADLEGVHVLEVDGSLLLRSRVRR
jgi:riboflavin biosynthesis pyrimidine reductase